MFTSVGIVGNGVVGSATGKALARRGFDVRSWDLSDGRSTHDLRDVIAAGVVFVCLPTPAYPDGSCDVAALLDFFANGPAGDAERAAHFVVRSTVPIGLTRDLHLNHGLPNVYHWPEFLTARTADEDADTPRCLILGKPGGWAFDGDGNTPDPVLALLARAFPHNSESGPYLYPVSSCESEAVKSLTNSFFAAKVALFNEFRLLADALGLDWAAVVRGMLADGRISPHHTKVPGPDGLPGFGGHCLPKDLNSVIVQCRRHGVEPHTLLGAAATNRSVRPTGV